MNCIIVIEFAESEILPAGYEGDIRDSLIRSLFTAKETLHQSAIRVSVRFLQHQVLEDIDEIQECFQKKSYE